MPTSPEIAGLRSDSSSIPVAPAAPVASPDTNGKSSVPKIKTINPDGSNSQNKLEAVKSSLKRVPHAPAMGKKKDEAVESQSITIDKVFSEGRRLEDEKSAKSKEVQIGKNETSDSVSPPITDPKSPTLKENVFEGPLKHTRSYNAEELIGKKDTNPDAHKRLASPEKERFIPITVEPPKVISASVTAGSEKESARPFSPPPRVGLEQTHGKPPPAATAPSGSLGRRKKEHYIPINVEGRGTILPMPVEDEEAAERRDKFHPNSLNRQRWGSRKKQGSSAYSDSSMSDEEGAFLASPFGGLQRYSSLGKHGMLEDRGVGGWHAGSYGPTGGVGSGRGMMDLRRGRRQPFAMQRAESFSSEEGDDDAFGDDDVYREMTAENLFSTLLTRVRSLTKRIHDEHDQHLEWQQTQRIMDHPLNPGGTHARLERNARRSSLKHNRHDGAHTPVSFSRQSSLRDAPPTPAAPPMNPYDDLAAGSSDRRPFRRGISFHNEIGSDKVAFADPQLNAYGAAAAGNKQFPEERYDKSDVPSDLSGSVSITSKQRLRPGYLPHPHLHLSSAGKLTEPFTPPGNPTKSSESARERTIPVTVLGREESLLPKRSELITSPLSPTAASRPDRFDPKPQQPEQSQDKQQRRVSRFLRPDFFETGMGEKADAIVRQVSSQKRGTDFSGMMDTEGKPFSTGLDKVKVDQPTASAYQQPHESAALPSRGYSSPKIAPSEGQFLSRAIAFKRQVTPVQENIPISSPSCTDPPPDSHALSTVITSSPSKSISQVAPPVAVTSQSSSFGRPLANRICSPVPFSLSSNVTPSHSSSTVSSSSPPPTRQTSVLSPRPLMSYAMKPFRRDPTGTVSPAFPMATSEESSSSSSPSCTHSAFPIPTNASIEDEAKDTVHPLQSQISLPATDSQMPTNPQRPPRSGRRPILPYSGAKSDGLLNKHAFISCNIIAAAERRKKELHGRASTSELHPMEKVI